MLVLRLANGERPHCPVRGIDCDPQCPWLMHSDGGDCMCAIALLPVTDKFYAMPMHVYQRGRVRN